MLYGYSVLVDFNIVVVQGHMVTNAGRAAPTPIDLKVTVWEANEELLTQVKKDACVHGEGSLTHDQWTGKNGTSRCGLSASTWRCDLHVTIGKRATADDASPLPALRTPGNAVVV